MAGFFLRLYQKFQGSDTSQQSNSSATDNTSGRVSLDFSLRRKFFQELLCLRITIPSNTIQTRKSPVTNSGFYFACMCASKAVQLLSREPVIYIPHVVSASKRTSLQDFRLRQWLTVQSRCKLSFVYRCFYCVCGQWAHLWVWKCGEPSPFSDPTTWLQLKKKQFCWWHRCMHQQSDCSKRQASNETTSIFKNDTIITHTTAWRYSDPISLNTNSS